MIASVEGVLVVRDQETVVQTGGLGLAILVPRNTVAALPAIGETVRFWTHLSVREDGWTLFGFLDQADLLMFKLLITVNGIGPKVALGILSGSSARETARMIQLADEKALRRLPGIGPKSAARMIIELGTRIPVELLSRDSALATATGIGPVRASDERTTALDMLRGMGLNAAKGEKILDEALAVESGLDADPLAWVKKALTRLG